MTDSSTANTELIECMRKQSMRLECLAPAIPQVRKTLLRIAQDVLDVHTYVTAARLSLSDVVGWLRVRAVAMLQLTST